MFGRKKHETTLFDGAIGTALLMPDEILKFAPCELNLKQPERVAALHWSYLEAGAEILTTNTFMAASMDRTDLFRAGIKIAREAIALFEEERIDKETGELISEQLNPEDVEQKAIEVAKAAKAKKSLLGRKKVKAEDQDSPAFNYVRPLIAASIGPCNDSKIVSECIKIAEEEGANYVIMESVCGLDQARKMVAGYEQYPGYACEAELAEKELEAEEADKSKPLNSALEKLDLKDPEGDLDQTCPECQDTDNGLPLIFMFTTGDDGRLLDGTTTAQAVDFIKEEIIPVAPMFAAGLNCSYGPAVLVPSIKPFLNDKSFCKIAMPSTDLYGEPLPPEIFLKHVLPLIKGGIDFIGSCCNSTPAHTLALREAIDDLQG